MKVKRYKKFGNGYVYALETITGKVVETTDTFLPYYTLDAVGRRSNSLINPTFGDRGDRWMIGVSTMSGCPVGCKFCATGSKFNGMLIAEEIVGQVEFIVSKNPGFDPNKAKEFKVLFTRMGEPALNHKEVNKAIELLKEKYPDIVIGLSTIGINNVALESWLELSKKFSGLQMQFSLHTTSAKQRDELMPVAGKITFDDIKDFGIRWMEIPNNKGRKISLNFTILEENEFSVPKLEKHFPKDVFFLKLSPLNKNEVTIENNLRGVIQEQNLV